MKSGGFTLIELMVVIAIIGVLASSILANLSDAQASARDAVRMQDMKSIRTAFERFYNDNTRYPNPIDGVPNSGQMIGVGNPIDDALHPYLDPIPQDPLHDAGTGVAPVAGALYFYSYDPYHWKSLTNCGGPVPADAVFVNGVFGFNKAEIPGNYPKDTCHGGNMNLNNADYNISLYDR
jgi:prepilin-type N-terminal cleavage/methylation domain-containing protein